MWVIGEGFSQFVYVCFVSASVCVCLCMCSFMHVSLSICSVESVQLSSCDKTVPCHTIKCLPLTASKQREQMKGNLSLLKLLICHTMSRENNDSDWLEDVHYFEIPAKLILSTVLN